MRTSRARLGALLLPFVLALGLVACDDQNAEEDPRGALREAVLSLRDYDGIEFVIGAQLDEAAQASALEEDMSEEELALLTGSTLTVRAVGGDGEDDGESEFTLVVGDETVVSLRALADTEVYALIDLPAIERVAEQLDAGPGFQQGLAELEQMAGMFGLAEVAAAAREAEWIRIVGVGQMMESAEQQAPEEDQPDEADLEQAARDIGQRLLAFLDDEEVTVDHLGSDDVGDHLRVTAAGRQLRNLVADVFTTLDDVAGFADPTGMGVDAAEIREELEASIPDDVEVSFDAWVDGGELSQVAVDVFAIAREAGEEDVPDGAFLIAVGLDEFTGPVEAPETDVTFDLFELFGGMLGGLGDLGGDPAVEDELDGTPDDGAPQDQPCVSEEELDQLLEQLPEEQRDLDEDELEQMLGLQLC